MPSAKTKYAVERLLDADSLNIIEYVIGISRRLWRPPGCKVCELLISHEIIGGEYIEGYWCGPAYIDKVYTPQIIKPHCWIQMPGGTVVDPTRHFYLPRDYIYVYHGLPDVYFDQTKVISELNLTCPAYSPTQLKVNIVFPADVELYVNTVLGMPPAYTYKHVQWLASRHHGKYTEDILRSIIASGYEYLINEEMRQWYYDTDTTSPGKVPVSSAVQEKVRR